MLESILVPQRGLGQRKPPQGIEVVADAGVGVEFRLSVEDLAGLAQVILQGGQVESLGVPGIAEHAVVVVVDVRESKGRFDRPPAMPPEAGGRVEAVDGE